MELTIPIITVILGLVFVAFGLVFLWKKANLGLGEILQLVFYSFIASGSVGVFVNATSYILTGNLFPGGGDISNTIAIGAVSMLLVSIYVYAKFVASKASKQQTASRQT